MSDDPQGPEIRIDDEDFASMLEESLEPATFREGQTVEGRVVSVGSEVAFVDVGGKGEATIDLDELADDDGRIDVRPGDIVQGVVVSVRGGIKLSHRLARRAASAEQLADAHRAGLPVEGRVERSVKGGYEVRVAGQRAFCPISQIDKAYTEDPAVHEGRVYNFRIIEHRPPDRLVLSRRALQEEEDREAEAEVRARAIAGAVLEGTVSGLVDYGAFVDLGGGVRGLLHVSEMGWSRVGHPSEVVQVGDEVDVQVLGVDPEKGRIRLGLKQLQANPWDDAADTFEVGQLLMGRVTRIAEFGAFVELAPGIEALAHASTFPPTGTPDGWKKSISSDREVAVEVLSVAPEERRIGVTILDRDSARARPRPKRKETEPQGSEGGGFGSLADQLRAAIRRGDD